MKAKYTKRAFNNGNVQRQMAHRSVNSSSNISRMNRLARREKLRAAGLIAGDETVLDGINQIINEETTMDNHYVVIRPTKGKLIVSLNRIGYGQSKAQGMAIFNAVIANAQQYALLKETQNVKK